MLDELRSHLPEMVRTLQALVETESPTEDTSACEALLADIGTELCGQPPDRLDGHLRWRFGGPTRVLLLGHFDTVWPRGTIDGWPFGVNDGVATGPGCFDMKAGLVQALFAVAALADRDGVSMLWTCDEETGSPTSRDLIVAEAAPAQAVLVCEPSADGALKTARKGVSTYWLTVEGRSAHAGLEPERGANALVELARHIAAVGDEADPTVGTTVTPTLAEAGTAINVVPERAQAGVDVRAATTAEQERVDRAMRALRTSTPGTTLRVEGGINRPPLEPDASAALFERAQEAARRLGIGELSGAAVGGGSDGNFTAASGVPTLDGLGPVGAGAHARDEHVLVDAMPERAALVAALTSEILEVSRAGTAAR